MLLHSTICWISSRRSLCGGRTTQRTILKACLNTAGEVCSRIAATVPTMMITNAAGDHNDARPAPLRMLPPTSEAAQKESNEAESIHGSGIGVYEWDLRHR